MKALGHLLEDRHQVLALDPEAAVAQALQLEQLVLPTLSLILAVLGASALKAEQEPAEVQQTFYSIARWLSAGYLGLVLVTILVEPLTALPALSLYKLSNLWLGPFQGLVTSAIGVLFFTREKTPGKATPPAD